MLYSFELTNLPRVHRVYTVVRNTLWQIAEREHLLIFIDKGFCRFSCGSEEKIARQGDVIFIPANQSYTRSSVDHSLCTMTYIHFSAENSLRHETVSTIVPRLEGCRQLLDNAIFSGEADAISAQSSCVVLQTLIAGGICPEIKSDVEAMGALSAKRLLVTNLQLSAHLCSILALLSRQSIDAILEKGCVRDVQNIPPKLRRAVSYIAVHYQRPISLDELSQHCVISKAQLTRYFNQAFHTTPLNYITRFKLARAKELLFYYPEISIKEIAAELGFDNQHYFSRVFARNNSESPTQYRHRTIGYKEPPASDV